MDLEELRTSGRHRQSDASKFRPGPSSMDGNVSIAYSAQCVQAFQAIAPSMTTYLGTQLLEYLLPDVERIAETRHEVTLQPLTISHVVTKYVRPVPHQRGQKQQLIPLLEVTKGRLVNRFAAKCDGKDVRILTDQESAGAMLHVVQAVFIECVGPIDQHGPLWLNIVKIIIADTPATEATLTPLKQRLARGADKTIFGSEKKVEVLTSILEQFSTRTLYLAVVPTASTADFLRLESVFHTHRHEVGTRPADWFRLAAGLTVRTYDISLWMAQECPSLHVSGTFDDALYLYRQRIFLGATSQLANGSQIRHVSSDTLGSASFHIHIRGPILPGASAPVLSIELRERPPGTLGAVFALALVLSVLISVVAVHYDAIFVTPASGSQEAPLWPPVVFAIPAIISSWVLSRFTADTVARLSITTLVISAWGAVDAAAAVGISAFRLSFALKDPWQLGQLHLSHPTWFLLWLASLMHVVFTACMLAVRASRFQRRLIHSQATTLT